MLDFTWLPIGLLEQFVPAPQSPTGDFVKLVVGVALITLPIVLFNIFACLFSEVEITLLAMLVIVPPLTRALAVTSEATPPNQWGQQLS